jgi:hypothetical protein
LFAQNRNDMIAVLIRSGKIGPLRGAIYDR